jgi:hypothetical protein
MKAKSSAPLIFVAVLKDLEFVDGELGRYWKYLVLVQTSTEVTTDGASTYYEAQLLERQRMREE